MKRYVVQKLKFPTKVTITSGGTAQSLSPGVNLLVTSFSVLWDPANSGTVYVGESDVTANKCFPISATTPSFEASADDQPGSIPFRVYNLKDVYIDGTTGDIVRIIYSIHNEGLE